MVGIVINGLFRRQHINGMNRRLAGAKVAIPARVGPTGYLQSKRMALQQLGGGRPELDPDLEASVRLPFAYTR